MHTNRFTFGVRARQPLWCLALAAALVTGVVGVVDSPPAAAATGYVVTDLGRLTEGAQDTTAAGINSAGWIVGTSANRPFLWKDGVLSDLGTLPNGSWGEAMDINDANQVVGQSYGSNPDCGNCAQGFVYGLDSAGNVSSRTALDQRADGGTANWANAISNGGLVAGYAVVPNVNIRAMLWSTGGTSSHVDDIPECFPCNSVFNAVNDAGHAVGTSGYLGAFYWNGSANERISNATNSWAYDLNDHDQVTGAVDVANGGRRAFLWAPGSTVDDLGLLPTGSWAEGRAINNNGHVVGVASVDYGNAEHAFVYRAGTMTDLNDLLPANSGWTLEAALGINDQGQIVGYGLHDGRRAAFLLTAAADTTAPITSATASPSPNSAGWNTGAVTVTLTAADEAGGSGVRDITVRTAGAQAAPASVVPGSQAIVQVATEGLTTIEFSAADNAGNVEAARTLTVAIDETAPVVTVQSPTAGSYLLHAVVAADYSCADVGSGVGSCSGPVVPAAAIDTATVGSKVFRVTAADKAGNAASSSTSYDVTFGIQLLYDAAKATKTIKVDLRDAAGLNVSSASVTLTARSIDGTVGASGLFSYSKRSASYSYTVNTTGLSRGTHTLQFTAGADPVMHSVPFQVR